MPLQVWLPFTKDLSNQGLSNYQIGMFRGTETYNDSGKFGKCFYANGVNTIKIYNIIPDFYNYNGYSLCAWFYIESQNTVHTGSAIVSAGNWNQQLLNLAVSNWSSDHYTYLRVSGTGWDKMYAYTFNLNTWYHVVVSSDGIKTYAYVNGVLIGDTQAGFLPTSIDGNDIAIGGATYYGGMQFFGRINDVRVYDHCLSPKETKLLSQGLVAHYQLNDAYLEGTTNLASKPDCLSSTCYNGAKGTYGYGTNTDMYKTVGVFEGKLCSKLYMGTSGASARPYPYISNLFVSNGTNAPAYKTLSFDYFSTIGTYIYPYKLGSGTATCNWTNPSANPSSGAFTNSGNIPIVAGKWNHITMILHGTTDANAEWGYIIMGGTHTSNTSNYWLFANMQLEEKDHATGYTADTRSENIVYDSSGFNNHMIAVGNPTVSSDSIRNIVSTYFINGQYALAQQNANLYLPKDSITVSLWTKCSTWGNPISCTEGGGWNFEDIGSGLQFPVYISGVGYKIANSGLSPSTLLNAWHMLTGTFDGTTLKIYVDAQLKGTTSTGTTNPIGYAANRLVISGEARGATPASSTYVGNVSDVRIYATALSAEDIQTLYNAPVSVANNGTMLTQGEFVEV